MKTKTGPARLRQIAEFTILSAAELRQLAAQWEADLERAALDHAVALSKQADSLLRAERAEAALERARALAEKWAAMKYNGDLTAAVYHGCAEELAALLAAASGGAA